jgi:hypothetical protein
VIVAEARTWSWRRAAPTVEGGEFGRGDRSSEGISGRQRPLEGTSARRQPLEEEQHRPSGERTTEQRRPLRQGELGAPTAVRTQAKRHGRHKTRKTGHEEGAAHLQDGPTTQMLHLSCQRVKTANQNHYKG